AARRSAADNAGVTPPPPGVDRMAMVPPSVNTATRGRPGSFIGDPSSAVTTRSPPRLGPRTRTPRPRLSSTCDGYAGAEPGGPNTRELLAPASEPRPINAEIVRQCAQAARCRRCIDYGMGAGMPGGLTQVAQDRGPAGGVHVPDPFPSHPVGD